MSDIGPQLDLDVGLVQVTFQHEPDASPNLRRLETSAPNNPYFQLMLEEVLYDPASQEQRVLAALQPQITNREIMQPWNFNAMIGQVSQWLEEKLKKSRKTNLRRKFRQARKTLKEFDELSRTLRRFLHALHRG